MSAESIGEHVDAPVVDATVNDSASPAPQSLTQVEAPDTQQGQASAAETTTEESTPDWFMKDKYKSIEDQAKAAFDLQKKMGKNWGAPDDYKLDGIEGFAQDDPILNHLKPAIKDLGLSQEGFSNLVKGYQNAQIEVGKKLQAELEKELTQGQAQTVQAVSKWLQDSFTPEDAKTIQSWIVNIKDFQLLNTMRAMMPTSTNIPSSTTGSPVALESSVDVENEKIKYRREVNQGLRVKDTNYEQGLQQRWKDAFTREAQTKK